MTRHIKIEGDLVTLVETSDVSTIALADWLPQIERRAPIYTPVMPTGTRAVWWDPTDLSTQKLVMLVEREPMTISMDLSGAAHNPMRLSIPWTRFMFYATTNNPQNNANWTLYDYRMMWSRSRFQSETLKDMTPALVPNIYEDGRICFGSTGVDATMSLADRIDSTVNGFYLTRFNRDLGIRYPNGWNGYTNWRRMTEENPTGWTEWPDLNPVGSVRHMYSWEDVCQSFNVVPDRNAVPTIAADGIPPLALGATFGRIQDWLGTLSPRQRLIMQSSLAGLTITIPPEPGETD